MNYKGYKIIPQVNITQMFSMFLKHFDKSYSFSGEYHNFWECVYVISGNICASGDERVYHLNPGDIIFHKPMELHKFYIDNPAGATLFIFSFSMDGNLCDVLKNSVFSLSEKQQRVIESLIEYVSGKPGTAQGKTEVQYISRFHSIPTYSQMVSVYLYRLFLLLAENGSSAPLLATSDAITFGNIVTYMHDHISENLSVDDIAEHICLSTTSLKRIFGRYAGMGVHKYFMQMKISYASSLLKEGKTVTETAEALGFSEQSYFSKVYKQLSGVSPSAVKYLSKETTNNG